MEDLTQEQIDKADLADVPLGVIRYEVVITEVRREVAVKEKEWKKGIREDDSEGYGYTPETLATTEKKREVYRQTVPGDLDLRNVIESINANYK